MNYDKIEPFTRMTIESIYGKVVIEVPEADLTIWEFYEKVLEPALLGNGYMKETVDALFEKDAQHKVHVPSHLRRYDQGL